MDTHQEAQIIARVQAGHSHDFESLVRHYQGVLFRIVGNLVRPYLVEDLVQDIFLAAFVHIQRFNPRRGTFRAWLFTIARNKALNARKKMREQQMPEGLMLADQRTPSDVLLVKEAFAQLDQALSAFNFQDRVIFVLAELEGLPYAEIAGIEGLPLGTVKSRLARMRVKLRNKLKSYAN